MDQYSSTDSVKLLLSAIDRNNLTEIVGIVSKK